MTLLFIVLMIGYLFGSFIFGLSAFFSYVSEITREPRYLSSFETVDFAKAVAFAILCWPFIWIRMSEAKRRADESKAKNA